MSDCTIRELKEKCGPNNPITAKHLNSKGAELFTSSSSSSSSSSCQGSLNEALKLHKEALSILDWNKCNALLFDLVDKSKEYALEMAFTLRKIGNVLRELNNFVGAAEVYKECLDTFLEALIENGTTLKRQLLECECISTSNNNNNNYQTILTQVNRSQIGRTLYLHPQFRALLSDIRTLFHAETEQMTCIKFCGSSNVSSSRRRRRRSQDAKMEENLKNAVASLSMTSSSLDSSLELSMPPLKKRSKSLFSPIANSKKQMKQSDSNGVVDDDNDSKNAQTGRVFRPRPTTARRSISMPLPSSSSLDCNNNNAEYECDHYYRTMSSMMVSSEWSLVIALERFPLPASVMGEENENGNDRSSIISSCSSIGVLTSSPSYESSKPKAASSILPSPLLGGGSGSKSMECSSLDSTERNSEREAEGALHHLAALSPVSVVSFQD